MSEFLLTGVFMLLSLGMISFATVGSERAVVSIKKVISKKPRSTIGVRSTLNDFFAEWFFDCVRVFSSNCDIIILVKMRY